MIDVRAEIRESEVEDKQFLTLTVIDNGRGMTRATINDIMINKKSRTNKANSLGLPFCRDILKGLGGNL